MEYIYEHLRALRAIHQKTQEYMGELLGVSQSTYSRIERGEEQLTLPDLAIIAKEFKMKAHELLAMATKPVYSRKEEE